MNDAWQGSEEGWRRAPTQNVSNVKVAEGLVEKHNFVVKGHGASLNTTLWKAYFLKPAQKASPLIELSFKMPSSRDAWDLST